MHKPKNIPGTIFVFLVLIVMGVYIISNQNPDEKIYAFLQGALGASLIMLGLERFSNRGN